MREPEDSAASAAEVVASLGAQWALMGALAANRYRASPRLTTDADLLVQRVDGIERAFREAGYEVRALASGSGEPPHLLYLRTSVDRVDVLLPVVDYQQVALDRAIDHVLSVEDVLIHKLIAWRPRDRDDVRSILEVGHELDDQYIQRWADEWGVADRWLQAQVWRPD